MSLLLVDEASRVRDDVYFAMRPSLAVSKGRIWLLSTPYGKRGFFWREWEQGGDEWSRFSAKAEDCSRITAEFLRKELATMGEEIFAQEYCGKFTESVGAIFDQELMDGCMVDDAEDWVW